MQKDKNIIYAHLKAVKSSPIKVVKVKNLIFGLSISESLTKLKFCNLQLAKPISKLIMSAAANAEHNFNMNVDDLYISKVEIGRAFALKRFTARGRGKAASIRKTFSKVSIGLSKKEISK